MAGLTNILNVPEKRILISNTQDVDQYGHKMLFKEFATDKPDFLVTKIDTENQAKRIENLQSNDGDGAVTVRFKYETDTKVSKTIAVRTFFSRKDSINTIEPVLSQDEYARTILMLEMLYQVKEKDAETLATTSGNYGSNTASITGTDQWSDYANSTPFIDLADWAKAARSTSLKRTNFTFIPDDVFNILANHPDTLDRLSTIKEKVLTPDNLATLLGNGVSFMKGCKIYIPNGFYNTSNTATPSMTAFWGKNVIVGYENPNPKDMIMKQSFGHDFQATKMKGLIVSKYSAEDKKGYYVDVEMSYSLSLDKNCGFLATTVTA